MIQVYTAVRAQQRICIPKEVTDAMGVDEGDWVRVTLLPGGRALVEPVPARAPDPVTEAGFAAQDQPGECINRGDAGGRGRP